MCRVRSAAELGELQRRNSHHGTSNRFIKRESALLTLLVRIHFIIVMIRWTGLAPREFEFPFPGSLTSTFLETIYQGCRTFSNKPFRVPRYIEDLKVGNLDFRISEFSLIFSGVPGGSEAAEVFDRRSPRQAHRSAFRASGFRFGYRISDFGSRASDFGLWV